MITTKKRALLSWSSGKDAAWALYCARQDPDIDILGLLTSYNASAGRAAMHGVRRVLVHAQCKALGLVHYDIDLPWPCSDEDYQAAMRGFLEKQIRENEITHVIFGDLFLEDVRAYREKQLARLGLHGIFPLWGRDTTQMAYQMCDAGLKAILTCVDPARLDQAFCGRHYDRTLLCDLPGSVDPCGENGEFHTFVYEGPGFEAPLQIRLGETVTRDGFVFADILAC